MNLIGKLKCWYAGGHLRMKRVGEPHGSFDGKGMKQEFKCPRCGKQEQRRVYARRVRVSA